MVLVNEAKQMEMFEFLQGSRVPPHPQLHSGWESVMELYRIIEKQRNP
jgi:hypothetical protein